MNLKQCFKILFKEKYEKLGECDEEVLNLGLWLDKQQNTFCSKKKGSTTWEPADAQAGVDMIEQKSIFCSIRKLQE